MSIVKIRIKCSHVVSTASFLLTCGTLAHAAAGSDAGAASSDSNAPSDTSQLQEVVVTAERREEKLSRVPVSVAAISAETLQDRAVTTEQDLAQIVPGLTVKNGQNSNQLSFTMRGQTLDPFSGTSPAVITYINEAPLTAGNTSTDLFDFSSVQVLKGPQGTLFGRNATGGAVLYQTTEPGNEFGGYATVRAGSRNMVQTQGAVDIPVVDDKLLVRLSGDYIRSDGYITNINTGHKFGDTDSKSGRITIVAKPTDVFKNVLVGQYSNFGGTEGAGGLYSYYTCGEKNNGFALTATMDCVYGPNSPFAPTIGNGPAGPGRWPGATAGYLAWQQSHPYQIWNTYDLPHHAYTGFVTNTSTLQINDDLSVKNIFSWAAAFARTPGILTGSPFGAIDLFNFSGLGSGPPGGETFDTRRYSEELQLQGTALDKRFNYIFGVFYDSKKETDYIPVVVGPELSPPLADIAYYYTDKDRSRAVFTQGTFKITDPWSVTLGGRYTWEQVGLNQDPGSLFTLAGFPTAPVQSQRLSAPSWTISTQYQIDPNNMVYADRRGSFRSGNFNGTVVPYNDLNFFQNEYAKDVEVGYKFSGRAMGAPTRFNIALYQEDVANAQHAVYAIVSGNPAGFTVNVPRQRTRGVEIESDVQPLPMLTVGLSGAYTDALYTSNIVDLSRQTGIPGYTIPFDSYPDTPKWTGTLYADVKLPVPGSIGEFILHGDVFTETSTYFSSNSGSITPRTELPGYTTTDVRLSWNDVMTSKFSLAFYVKNLTNRLYYASGYTEGASGGFNTALWGEPRTYGGEVSVKF